MSDNLSQEYADSIADDLREIVANGKVLTLWHIWMIV